MDILVRQQWSLTASSASTEVGGQPEGSTGRLSSQASTRVLMEFESPLTAQYHTLSVAHSTLATTNSLWFQSAQYSSGPWFTEASTQLAIGNVSTAFAMHVSGPVGPWVRPFLGTVSTGVYQITYLAVG